MWPNDIAGLGWMPWVVLDGTGVAGRRQARGVGGAGGRCGVTGRAGNCLLTWFLGALWLGHFYAGRFSRVSLILRAAAAGLLRRELRRRNSLPSGFAATICIATRLGTGASWAMPLSGSKNFLVPLFHCFAASQECLCSMTSIDLPHYLGAGLMALALAVRGGRGSGGWLLLAVAVKRW